MSSSDIIGTLGLIINGGLLTVGIIALCFARHQALASRATAAEALKSRMLSEQAQKSAAQQTKRDSQAATRPYLYARIVPGLTGIGGWDLEIRNVGRSAARGLVIDALWPNPGDDLTTELRHFLTRPQDLPPGCSVRLLWRLTGNFDDGSTFAGMPEETQVSLCYRSDDAALGDLTDSYALDATGGRVFPAPQQGATSSSSEAQTLKNINLALRALNVHVGELRR